MANDYCTVQEVLDAMPDVEWGATYGPLLAQMVTRASRAVDAYLGRKPGAFYVSADVTRYFNGSGGEEQWIDELAAAPTSVAVAEDGVLTDYTVWAATDYLCWPYNALDEGLPFLRLDVDVLNGSKAIWADFKKAVRVVGKFGFSATVPEEIREATIIQAVRWLKRGQQAFADAGAVAELGQLRYVRKVDPDVETLLSAAKFQRLAI